MNPSEKKISYVINSLATGGAERMLLRQLRRTTRKPTVYTLGGPDDLRSEFEAAGARIVDVGDLGSGYIKTVWMLRCYLSEEMPDIVHSHLPQAHIVARPAAKLAGINHIISTHHNVSESRAYQSRTGTLEKLTRFLDTVEIAVSEAVLRTQRSFVDFTRWEVIHNAIDVEEFHKKVIRTDSDRFKSCSPVFLNVGRYVEQKGQQDIIRAMPAVLEEFPDAAAIIVGWGPRETYLRELCDEYGVSDKVYITGKVQSVHEYYSAADIFVFPSHWEGFGIVLLEAMASGLPIVGTDTGAIPDVIGESRRQIPSAENPNELADAMISMAHADVQEKGKQMLQHARENFDISELVDDHARLYSQILSER